MDGTGFPGGRRGENALLASETPLAKPLWLAALSVVMFFALATGLQLYAKTWSWKNEHLYSAIDGLGGGISILFGFVILLVRPYRTGGTHLPIIAYSFIAMGLVEANQPFASSDLVSAWFDCLSLLVGAIFLTAVWLPEEFVEKYFAVRPRASLVAFFLLFFFFLSLGVLLSGETWLPSLTDQSLPVEIKILSFLSGFVYLMGAGRILRRVPGPERLTTAVICFYLGLGGITLPLVTMWGPRWWLVQLVQFIPMLGALWLLVRNFLSSQKALFQSEERFRALVKASPVGIGVINNREYKFAQANPALCSMLGFTEAELTSKDLRTLIYPEDIYSTFEERNKLMRGETPSYRSEKRYLNRDRQVVWVKASGALIRSETGTQQEFRVIEDITEEKLARERAALLMEELTRTNAELDRFTSIASHDLKSPLRTIRMYVDLLSRKLSPGTDREIEDFMGFISDAGERLSMLVDDLLTYSRVSKDTHQFEPTDCSAIAKDALENLRFDLESCGGTVTIDPLPTILGDRVQLLQLLQNLLSNALKYRGAEPPQVRISAQKLNEEWVFSVSDNGIGFDMKNSEKIFGEFQRLHSSNEYPGTGLGLPICKTIVRRHGGRIWARSSVGQGATFFFSLPKRPERNRLFLNHEKTIPHAPTAEKAQHEAEGS